MRFLSVCFVIASACASAQSMEYRGGINPYYPGLDTPKLTTPMWYGEPGVEAVVILSIDDMREPEKYEEFLRPILDRLKQIDGRAPMSIFANVVPPNHPHLQSWLAEGLSIECHTRDHPCPLLGGKPLGWSEETYDTCVDQMAAIPGNTPVAFRMPCCDSQNTVSPRFFAEIFDKPTPGGRFLQIDSSVFNITTPDDPDLPRELVVDPDGREKFRKYLPFPSYVNTIENYPYPYLIAGTCWEFPCAVPSDWEAQNLNKPDAQQSVDDMKAALDVCVVKQGVYTLVFHPHKWIKNTQIVELIDHAVAKYGSKVKFITFLDAAERLEKNLLGGGNLRMGSHRNPNIQVYDENSDNYLDVLFSMGPVKRLNQWQPDKQRWEVASLSVPVSGLKTIDIDGDGKLESVSSTQGVTVLSSPSGTPLMFSWPTAPGVPAWSDAEGVDSGVRLLDVDNDGDLDFLYSNDDACGLLLFQGVKKGWSQVVYASLREGAATQGAWPIPPFVSKGQDRGAWFHSRHIWWQNEDTSTLPDLVDRRSFNDLLQGAKMGPVPARHAEKTLVVRPGYEAQLVASEPLVSDPVSMAWGADGALWVTEMHDYPNGVDGKGKAGSRVVRLVDEDGDGVYDRSRLFLKDLAFATGCMPWRDGVLVTVAPDILFARDTDGDGAADEVEKLFTGFGEGNQQHRINGLRWGLDNWIYCANGDSGGVIQCVATGEKLAINGRDFRFRPDTGEMQAISGQTQFGRVMNDEGDWFGNANWHPGWHYHLDETQLSRNPHFSTGEVYREFIEDTQVYPVSRLVPRFNDFHLANHYTSACGMDIYRDGLLGAESRGDAFVCEPVHNLVSRFDLQADGATYLASKHPGEEQHEFLASTDNWFRPVAVRTGPDGALYVADMYREQIEHPEYINERDQAASDFRAGEDRGRIYRVYPVGQRPGGFAPLTGLDGAALVGVLAEPNGTRRDLAHQLLLHRDDPADLPVLRKAATAGAHPWTRLHALGILEGRRELDDAILLAALEGAHAPVRRFAVTLSQPRLLDSPALANVVIARATDGDAFVRKAAAYALGDCAGDDAGAALAKVLDSHHEQPILLTAALSSIHTGNLSLTLDALVGVMAADAVPSELRESGMVLSARTAVEVPGVLHSFSQRIAQGPEGSWRFDALREIIEAANVDALADEARMLLASARKIVADSAAEPELRAAAAQLLGNDPASVAEDTARLCSLVDGREPVAVVQAALDRLRALLTPDAAAQLIAAWPGYSPEIRRDVASLLMGNDGGLDALLGALESGAISKRQLNPAERQRLLHQGDETISARAKAVFADVGNPDRAAVLTEYAKASTLSGNAPHGREIFLERCATCHELGGVGHRVGPNLAMLADRSFDKLLSSVLDPNRGVEERYLNYEVSTLDFATYTGIVTSESGNSITLTGPDGVETVVLRGDIQSMQATPLSPMPEGLEEGLSLQDFADLLAFVSGSAAPPKTVEGNKPERIVADAAGNLTLGANQAEIYGPTLTFKTEYKNLGGWKSMDDLAVWDIEVPKAGEYSVRMEYCCDNRSANNPFVIQVGGETLTGHVAGTGTWNQYEKVLIGTMNLPQGKARLTFKSQGEPEGSLIELRSLVLNPR